MLNCFRSKKNLGNRNDSWERANSRSSLIIDLEGASSTAKLLEQCPRMISFNTRLNWWEGKQAMPTMLDKILSPESIARKRKKFRGWLRESADRKPMAMNESIWVTASKICKNYIWWYSNFEARISLSLLFSCNPLICPKKYQKDTRTI